MDGVKFGKLYAAGVAALVLAAALGGCSTPAILVSPPTGPGTEWPCGLRGVVCGGGMCCWSGDVCGGKPFSGCPAASCCFVGDDGMTGARPPRPQWRASEMRSSPTP
jgi:hypothetical protein